MPTHLTYDDGELICADNLEWMRAQPTDSVDLCFGSPPYMDARTYGIGFNLTGDEWVEWMADRWEEMQRITKGLVAMVVDSPVRDHRWTAGPILLGAELIRRGLFIRRPPVYMRNGIPGSGGDDWLRNDYEFIISTSKGALPWSDNLAMGQPPKYKPGGNMCHKTKDGSRVDRAYVNPEKANPGNVIRCGSVGGKMGCDIAHEGDAPFPEYLAEFFIRSFCPPGGIVLDPFSGTGTTVSAARQQRRRFIGIDVRESEIEKASRRLINGAIKQGFDV